MNLLEKLKGERKPEESLAAHPKALWGCSTTSPSFAISNSLIVIQWSASFYVVFIKKKLSYQFFYIRWRYQHYYQEVGATLWYIYEGCVVMWWLSSNPADSTPKGQPKLEFLYSKF